MYLVIRAAGANTASGLRSGARATAGGGRSGPRVVAAARLRMRLRVLLEEADALIDVLRVPVDGRHRDAGEVVREEAAGSVVVAVGGAVAAALPVRGAAGEEDTDTDTDRVPSHTSRRDRRDDQRWRNPSRTFSQHVYDERAPRDAGGFSFALSTRQALDQGRRAPIAH